MTGDRYIVLMLAVALVICSLLFQMTAKALVDQSVTFLLNGSAPIYNRLWDLRQLGLLRPAIAMLLAFALMAIWLGLLAKLNLSVATPIAAITIVTNAIGGGYILGESVSTLRMGGVLVVAVGIMMVLFG